MACSRISRREPWCRIVAGERSWCGGNFNGDGVVDGQDFIEWNTNKFTSSDSLSAVPEPTGTLMLILSIAAFGLRRWKT